MAAYKVGYIVGSLAAASINRLLATALIRLAPRDLTFTEISFKELPIYNYDYDADFPPVARAFKNAIAASDAILFVTPEYNRSIPAVSRTQSIGRAARGDRIPLRANPPVSSGHRPARSALQLRNSSCAACSVSAIRRR
jgi:NAD(P)H-dependent FMN reductase